MLMDLLHGFEVLSTTEETLFSIQFVVVYAIRLCRAGNFCSRQFVDYVS